MGTKTQTPLTKRANFPNLLRRPRAPAAGRGRLQVQIRRAFVVREVLTSSEIYDSCYAKRRMLGQQIDRPYRWSVLRILRQIADPIGRTKPYGAVLWRLKSGDEKKPHRSGAQALTGNRHAVSIAGLHYLPNKDCLNWDVGYRGTGITSGCER
jgi:hypothetical protein